MIMRKYLPFWFKRILLYFGLIEFAPDCVPGLRFWAEYSVEFNRCLEERERKRVEKYFADKYL